MARTHRSIVARSHRNMTHMNYRRTELSALEQIKEQELLSNQTKNINRLCSWQHRIVNPWNDYPVSAGRTFENKVFWEKVFHNMNNPHFTRNQAD